MSIVIGSLLAAAWAGVLLWVALLIGVAAGRRQLWGPVSDVIGILGAGMVTAGLVLIVRHSLAADVFGVGALLAGAGTLAVWSGARATMSTSDNGVTGRRPSHRSSSAARFISSPTSATGRKPSGR